MGKIAWVKLDRDRIVRLLKRLDRDRMGRLLKRLDRIGNRSRSDSDPIVPTPGQVNVLPQFCI